MDLLSLNTPALILDRSVVTRNTARMANRMRQHGVALRPHLKTAKSAQVAQTTSRTLRTRSWGSSVTRAR